jgi:hypothetical protein
MERTTYASFEGTTLGQDDRSAIVYLCDDVYNVSFYVNNRFVYSVPQCFECPTEAKREAISFVAGMMFDVTVSE